MSLRSDFARLLALIIAATLFFSWLALDANAHRGIASGDVRILRDVISVRTGALDGTAKFVTRFGSTFQYPMLIAAGIVCWRRTGAFALPLSCLAWFALGQLLRFDVSRVIARPRPPLALHLVGASGYAFPSGHTTSATMGFGLVAVLLIRSLPRRRIPLALAATAMVIAVGCSRVYLGVHWPSDVVGGWVLGIDWLALGGVLMMAASSARRRRRRRGP